MLLYIVKTVTETVDRYAKGTANRRECECGTISLRLNITPELRNGKDLCKRVLVCSDAFPALRGTHINVCSKTGG